MNRRLVSIFLLLSLLLVGCDGASVPGGIMAPAAPAATGASEPAVARDPVSPGGIGEATALAADNPGGFEWDGIYVPEWDGNAAWVELEGNDPRFAPSDLSRTDPFEDYAELDALGRCGVAYANVCLDLMPTEARGDIGSVRPSGWHTVKYNDLVSGNYLYNRCHLIGFQLAGENANPLNLITGTRYLNIDGMLDFENMIDDYVEETSNHVLYRVTPVFVGDELVARGVAMEAYSVEDGGEGVKFFVFAYDAQPGIGIDYATGESWRLDGKSESEIVDGPAMPFVLNVKSGKFHLPSCQYADGMAEANRLELEQPLSKMLEAGYSPCGSCHPDEAEG